MTESTRPISQTVRSEVLLRLKRIEGQVRGIQRMVDEGRDCREIINQIAAIRAALISVNAVVLECYAHSCLDGATSAQDDEAVAELIHVMLKAIR